VLQKDLTATTHRWRSRESLYAVPATPENEECAPVVLLDAFNLKARQRRKLVSVRSVVWYIWFICESSESSIGFIEYCLLTQRQLLVQRQ
jgi:hypothetical protein